MKNGMGILSAIGSTPLIELRKIHTNPLVQVFAKLEGFNPGGSSKDRPALNIIQDALAKGIINSKTTIIESSSGNMAIGLAQICAYYGMPFICVVDSRTTTQNLNILKAYGAHIEMITQPDPETGELLIARLKKVQALNRSIANSFWPNQYANIENAMSHYHNTMREIDNALDGQIDYIFCGTSTCGTIRGCADYIRNNGLRTKIIAVDALGSNIFQSPPTVRKLPGLGAAIVPGLLDESGVDSVIHVSDLECIMACRKLVREEAVLAGGSSGGVYSAFEKWLNRTPAANATCVLIFPDRGERYMDTVYSDQWVQNSYTVELSEEGVSIV